MPSTTRSDQKIEDALGDADVAIPFKYSITSYGADYPVDALVRRMKDKAIYKPDFQRSYVWTLKQASRFIESLLLGLPIPGIFLAQDPDSSKLSVLDGLQRLETLKSYLNGVFPYTERKFRLRGVQNNFEGMSYDELDADDRIRLDNYVIHATIVRQDDPDDDQSSIYYLFERINTGGTPLSPQEIRACLYWGDFMSLLSTLNDYEPWREIFGRHNRRLRDQELILRFVGLLYYSSSYKRPMKTFLNRVSHGNRHLLSYSAEDITNIWQQTIDLVLASLGPKAFRPKTALNAAVFDSVMVGLAKRIESKSSIQPSTVRKRYSTLLKNPKYLQAVTKSTADDEAVKDRIAIATKSFPMSNVYIRELNSLNSRMRKIRDQFTLVDPDIEMAAEIGKLYCVLIAGRLEAEFRAAIEQLCQLTNPHKNIRSATIAFSTYLQNPRAGKLEEVLRQVNPSIASEFAILRSDESIKSALNSIVNTRNSIAHGRPASITLAQARTYEERLDPVFELIAKRGSTK